MIIIAAVNGDDTIVNDQPDSIANCFAYQSDCITY